MDKFSFLQFIEEEALAGPGRKSERIKYEREKYILGTRKNRKGVLDPTSKKIGELIQKVKSKKYTQKEIKASPLLVGTPSKKSKSLPQKVKPGFSVVPHHNPDTDEEKLESLFHVFDKQGKRVGQFKLPHTSIQTRSNLSQNYNYEMAPIRLYNHMISIVHRKYIKENGELDKEGLASDEFKELMKGEIQKSRNDKSHALSFENANADDFNGKKKTKKGRETHDAGMDDAVSMVHAIFNNPDFEKNVTRGDELAPSGKAKGTPSDLILKCHGITKDGKKKLSPQSLTFKGDAIVFNEKGEPLDEKEHGGILQTNVDRTGPREEHRSISLKKEDAQLTSNGPNDSEAIMRAAANEYFGKHLISNGVKKDKVAHYTGYNDQARDVKNKPIEHITDEHSDALIEAGKKLDPKNDEQMYDHVSNVISHIKAHMQAANIEGCDRLMKHLHEIMPHSKKRTGFLYGMYDHAASGRYKFADSAGVATHMGETGENGTIRTLSHYLDLAHKSGQMILPRFALSKHTDDPGLAMRIGTPKSHKFAE